MTLTLVDLFFVGLVICFQNAVTFWAIYSFFGRRARFYEEYMNRKGGTRGET